MTTQVDRPRVLVSGGRTGTGELSSSDTSVIPFGDTQSTAGYVACVWMCV